MPRPEIAHCSLLGDYSNEQPRLRFADGGRLLKLSFSQSPAAQWNGEMFGGRGGVRGRCMGFSAGSRRRLLDRLNTVSKAAELPQFLTLTLPDDVFNDDAAEFAKQAKHWLDNFLKRLDRVCSGACGFWRIEWQSRKSGIHEGKLVPHFHLLVWGLPVRSLGDRLIEDSETGQVVGVEQDYYQEAYVDVQDLQLSLSLLDLFQRASPAELKPGEMSVDGIVVGGGKYRFAGSTKFVGRCQRIHDAVLMEQHGIADKASKMSLQDWASLAWYNVVDSHNLDHLKAGVRVERVRTWGGVMSYCAKYLAKCDAHFLSDVAFGRSWGIFNRAAVPWARLVDIDLDGEVGVRVRRVMRRYLERRFGRKVRAPYGLTLYCDTAQWLRLCTRPPIDPF
jgi:hypothetical protein